MSGREPVELRPTRFTIPELEPPGQGGAVQWMTQNLDKVLAALTAILALLDVTHVTHAEWAVAVAAILTFVAEWLHPRFQPRAAPPGAEPQAQAKK